MSFIASKRCKRMLIMVVLEVKVYPNSGRQSIELHDNSLRCYIKSTPEKGKANNEVIKLLAKKLDLPTHSFCIISGMTTRNKLVKMVTSLTKEQVMDLLVS